MKCMGRLFRHFNDGVPDYDDLFVKNWLISRGEDFEYYSHYDVVIPKREYARTALARYDRPEDPFSNDVKRFYDIAGEWLWLEFGEHMCDSKISSNDAVEQHLRDDKSPGAPWNLVGVNSKGDYFSNYAEFYAKYWDLLATPDYIRSLCSSSIKEELRTAEKVRSGQVRTIISMDVNHVKAHCQLTLDQNEKLMATVGKHSSCIGLVQQYGGWNALDRRMSAFGPLPCTLELDGKQFDAKFRYYCFQKIRDFRYRCLRREYRNLENKARFHNLYRELCFGFFVDVDGHVYSRSVGNPSGQGCTTPDNMFKNFMDIVVLWHLIMPESYHNYRDFHNLLILCIVGDDVNISVHPSIQHIFNAKAIFDVMHKIDMEYTTPCMEFRHNRDCEFLSHGFEECLGMMLPVIDCRKMRTSMLKFNTSGKISETIMRACGLRNETFACAHCRDWFSELIQDLRFEYGDSCDHDVVSAWKSYKTDAELWSLYTGLKYSDVCVALASASRSPEYKFARRYLQSQIMTQSKKKVKKAAKKVAVKEVKKLLKGKGRKTRRKGNVLHGKGGYWGDMGKRLGGHLGGVADEVLGVGKALTGVGSYKVKANSIYESGGPPAIVNSKYVSRVRHREFLCDVYGSTNFNITQFSINPGVVRTFPWLSGSAQGYEQYKIHGMVFEFHSTSATSIGSTNTALGTVIMATEYNSNLPPFVNKQQMENHEYTTAVCPDHSALHPVECARSRTTIDELYVRSANATGSSSSYPASYNPLLYDLGQFYIATVGMQAGVSIIGELWISYEIEFLKPAQSLASTNATVTHFYYDSTSGSAPTSGAAFSNLRNKYTGMSLGSGANGFTSMPVGRYLLSVSGVQSSNSSTVPSITYSGGAGVSMLNTTASTGVSTTSVIGIPNSTGALTTFQWLYSFEITDPSNSITMGSFTSGTISSMDVFLMPYPPGFTLAESRKAVDWDPIAILSRKVMELESRLSTVNEEEDEKYFESGCSTPVDVEPVTRSTADLAESLLARIGRRSAVTDKTAVVRSQ